MAKPGTLAYECQIGCVSTTLQILVALACVLVALYVASLVLEGLPAFFGLVGLPFTTVPPGIRYADYYHPAFVPKDRTSTPIAERLALIRSTGSALSLSEYSSQSAQEQLAAHRQETGKPGSRLLRRFAER
jgi:hypothetical protein